MSRPNGVTARATTSDAARRPDLSHVDWDKVALGCDTLPALIDHCLARCADTELLVFDCERITYAEAFVEANTLSHRLLSRGIGKGERIGILLPNGPQFVVSWFAIGQIGAVAVPISTLSSPAELRRILTSSGISLLITTDAYLGHSFAETIAASLGASDLVSLQLPSPDAPYLRTVWSWSDASPAWVERIAAQSATGSSDLVDWARAQVTPSDPVSIIYTSGSTSAPKGVIHSHGNFLRSAQRWAASMDFRAGDRVFNSAPFFWVGGLVTGFLTLMEVGATLIGTSLSGSALVDVLIDERCTLLGTSAHLTRKIYAEPGLADRDWSHMRGGSLQKILPPELRTRNQIYFGNALGMTETAGPHTLALPDVDDDHIGSMGPPSPGMEHRIVDPETGIDTNSGGHGELLVRGDTLMLGYVGRESRDVLDADGWFHTGDLCSLRDGQIFLHGRRDSVIKVAGANVAPAEVEAALLTIDGVDSAFAMGLPDPERGHVVGVLIVPHAGATLDAAMIMAQARKLLSPYKVPRRIRFIDAAPLTATGKLDQRAARALVEAD